MANRRIALCLLVAAAATVGACSRYGTGPKEYSTTNDTGLGAAGNTAATRIQPPAQDDPSAKGATKSNAGGGSAASTPAPTGPQEKEAQRGNTPPGVSRDGAGPAGGAIVDPSGAVTKGR